MYFGTFREFVHDQLKMQVATAVSNFIKCSGTLFFCLNSSEIKMCLIVEYVMSLGLSFKGEMSPSWVSPTLKK